MAPSAAFERADVRVGETQAAGFIDSIVAETQPDTVYHLASLLSGSSETDSDLAWRVNLDGIRYVLEAARVHGVGRVLFPSSVATFGMGVGDTVTDDSPQWPAGLYGVTKVLGERLGVYYHQRFGVDFRCVRLSAMVAPTAPAAGAASAFVCELYMGAVREGGYTFKVYSHSRIPLVWGAGRGRRAAATARRSGQQSQSPRLPGHGVKPDGPGKWPTRCNGGCRMCN